MNNILFIFNNFILGCLPKLVIIEKIVEKNYINYNNFFNNVLGLIYLLSSADSKSLFVEIKLFN